jgi:hypothetical protein
LFNMKRRDTERNHSYAHEVFSNLMIYDIQGLLKEGDVYKCGVEAYQVKDFSFVAFDLLNQDEEVARFKFCAQLGIPYFMIITSEETGGYQIYIARLKDDKIEFEICYIFSKEEFISWWRQQQTFDQKKAMYVAQSRISESIIDKDLVSNSLAWGINIDGFSLGQSSGTVRVLYEKRICTYKTGFNISNYDPQNFFHGTSHRSGDSASWKILFELSKKLNAALMLLTFDTRIDKSVGAARVSDIHEKQGITYNDDVKPHKNIFNDDLVSLKSWIKSNV